MTPPDLSQAALDQKALKAAEHAANEWWLDDRYDRPVLVQDILRAYRAALPPSAEGITLPSITEEISVAVAHAIDACQGFTIRRNKTIPGSRDYEVINRDTLEVMGTYHFRNAENAAAFLSSHQRAWAAIEAVLTPPATGRDGE